MIGKKDYMETMELQLLKKEKASLESKLFKKQQEQQSLKEKVENLENEKESLKKLIESAENRGEVSKISLSEIKLRTNIRDEYEFEEIEDLANDIVINSQLQPVLITNDNYLISGHRRYFAIKFINENPEKLGINFEEMKLPDFIVTYKIERKNSDISDTELQEIQYSENNERRSIDNFQLSNLFNSYLDKGFEQKYIVEKFKKTKGNVSSIVAIKKIDPKLIRLLKEFQIYAWSKSKFLEENNNGLEEFKQQYYLNNRGIIGWKPLYQIAKQNSLINQKKEFLSLYSTRLSESELKSNFFSDCIEMKKEPEKAQAVKSVLKHTNNLNKMIKDLKNVDNNKVNDIINDIKLLQQKIQKL
jgi:hypothetical protein